MFLPPDNTEGKMEIMVNILLGGHNCLECQLLIKVLFFLGLRAQCKISKINVLNENKNSSDPIYDVKHVG